jgi:hypothetical protein
MSGDARFVEATALEVEDQLVFALQIRPFTSELL